ncbi:MAG TPA: hypothetical protein PLG59_17225 [bacterium]|nr:hypothetical protein [bacterium]
MRVTFFCPSLDGRGGKCQEQLKAQFTGTAWTYCGTISDLILQLNRSREGEEIVLLFAETKESLIALLAVRDVLLRHRIILILPDGDKETILQGHKLMPRFLSYMDSDFKDVAAVLARMLERAQSAE